MLTMLDFESHGRLNHVSIQNRAILLVSVSAPEANKGVTAFSQSASTTPVTSKGLRIEDSALTLCHVGN